MYKIYFRGRVIKQLNKKLHPRDKDKVIFYLEKLAVNPFTQELDIKKLTAYAYFEKGYRLRVGEIRVFYEIDTDKKEIIVYNIDYRRTTTYS